MKHLLLLILLILPLSCYNGLNDMYDNLGMKVPICVDETGGDDGNDGRGWGNAFQTLQAAIDAAEDGDEIWVAEGSYTVASMILQPVSIYGGFKGLESRRDQSRPDINITALNMTAGPLQVKAASVIEGIIFASGTSGALFVTQQANVIIKNCIFNNNLSNSNGGAIRIDDLSTVEIFKSVFTGNTSTMYGGAISADGSDLIIKECIFGDKDDVNKNNEAHSGGAIYAFGGSTVTISDNCEFYRNRATHSSGAGGAIYINNATLNISRTKFGDEAVANSGNTAEYQGGAIYIFNSLNVTISDNTQFYRNSSVNQGGAIWIDASNLNIVNSTLGGDNVESGNESTNSGGGGIYAMYMSGRTLNISGTQIKNNTAEYSGGGIYQHEGILNISGRSYIVGNKANGGTGGGISSEQGTVNITDSYIQNNSSSDDGGGIRSTSTVNVSRSEISGNISDANGGGVSFAQFLASTLQVDSCKFVSNKATGGAKNGGAIYVNAGKSSISACTFNSNSSTGSGGALFYGQTTASTVVNSYFFNNNAYNGGALHISGHDGHALVNLTFYKNSAGNQGGAIYTTRDNIVYNSVFFENTAALQGATIWANGYFTMRYCYYYEGLYSLSSSGPGNFTLIGQRVNAGNPFVSVSPDASNFLYPSTGLGEDGLINNGTVDFSAILAYIPGFTIPATDLAGNTRIRGGAIDIGAYERQ